MIWFDFSVKKKKLFVWFNLSVFDIDGYCKLYWDKEVWNFLWVGIFFVVKLKYKYGNKILIKI